MPPELLKQMRENPGLFFSNLRSEADKRLIASRGALPRDRALLVATSQIAQVGAMSAQMTGETAGLVLARSIARFEALMTLSEDLSPESLVAIEALRIKTAGDYLRINGQPVPPHLE